MLHYFQGTVFNTSAQTIVNTVNCMGIMGTGIALEFKLRYPKMFEDYKKRCENKEVELGKPYVFKVKEDLYVLNFPTKYHWKYPSRIDWIEQGLNYFVENYKAMGIKSIAFPKLGCGHGDLNWDDVKAIMEKYLKNLDIDVYICLDEKKEAEGIEKEMLEILNKYELKQLIDEIGISKKQAQLIYDKFPFKRIRDILRIKGVGEKTYNNIFRELYGKALAKDRNADSNNILQLSFFETKL